MPFLTGRISYTRFRVAGRPPRSFSAEHIDALAANAIGKKKVAAGDGSQMGWTAGGHALDTRFDLAKNIVNDALQFAIRVDENKPPAELLKAYTAIDLEALAANNPSGIPSARQKREARQTAKERLEEEARDGRFLRRKVTPILWDTRSNELLVGTASPTTIDRVHALFHATFGKKFELMGAGYQAAGASGPLAELAEAAAPSAFTTDAAGEVAWSPDETSRDFLGNEFLLWLWWYLENVSDTVKLSDGSEVAAMVARTLMLQCPRGQTGKDSISSDGPAKLPESLRAIQAGKLPRKVGLTLVRQDAQYELTLQAETLAVSGAKLPAADGENEWARMEERVTQIRHLVETVDLVYGAFLARRLVDDVWAGELAEIKRWLGRDGSGAAAGAGRKAS